MGLSNRSRHGLTPDREGNSLGHSLIERADPVDHGNLCCADLPAHVGVLHPQLIDPSHEITRLLRDLLRDVGTTGLVLGCH